MASRTKAFNQMILLPIFLISCFVLLSQCANTEAGEDLVTETCKHTLHFQACVSSLRSVPSSNTTDLKGLAEIALNVSTTEAIKTLSYVHDLKSSDDGDTNNKNGMSSSLNDCDEQYSEAIQNLKDSVEALANGDYNKVNALVSAAMTNAETCQNGFEEMLGDDNDSTSTSTLTQNNRYFSELCSNVLAITKLIV